MKPNRPLVLLLLVATASMLTLAFSLTTGSMEITIGQLWQAANGSGDQMLIRILWDIRVPRTLAAFVTGGLLAMSGVIMQVLLRNPLADPYILGVSGGAATAALSALLAGVAGVWIPQAAFAGALLSIGLVFGIAGSGGQWSVTRLLLTGVVVSAGWGAVINILLASSSSNTVQSMLFWLMGDLSQNRASAWHGLVLLGGLAGSLLAARSLNVMIQGESTALALGVDVRRLRVLLYLLASLLTAAAVTVAGSIGFVGLVVPHMLRLLGARDHRLLIPFSLLVGGSFLVLADSLARSLLAPQQLPTGVVTALIGVPVFLVILRTTMRQRT